jgi:hypothetical protein
LSIQALNWAFSTFIDNPGAKLVLIALANFASHPRGAPNDQQECWPAQSHLCKITSLSPSSIQRHLKQLTDAGHISVRREIGTLGQFGQNIYVLNMAPPAVTVNAGPAVTLTDGTSSHPDQSPAVKYAISTGQGDRYSINPLEPLKENRPPAVKSPVNIHSKVLLSDGNGNGNHSTPASSDDQGVSCHWTDKPTLPSHLKAEWKWISNELKDQLNRHTYETWATPIRLVSVSPWRFWVPNQHFVNWWTQESSITIIRKVLSLEATETVEFGPFEIQLRAEEVSA